MLQTRFQMLILIQVSTKVTYDVKPGTQAAISFNIPDQKSGKVIAFHFEFKNKSIYLLGCWVNMVMSRDKSMPEGDTPVLFLVLFYTLQLLDNVIRNSVVKRCLSNINI